MAVGLQLPPFSKSNSWDLANPKQLHTRAPKSMTSTMSYQYPIPSSAPNTESHSSTIINYHSPSVILPPHTHSLPKPLSPIKRGASVGQKHQKMKRSLSTPNVRGQAKQDQAESARRNKLGYHRTSVACGHCRRRKIRCIPAAGDQQNRCSNCIRLKKECKFFAVDQQPQSDQRRDPEIQRPSTSTSPIPGGQTSTMHRLNYTDLSIHPVQELGETTMKGPRAESFSPENKAPFPHPQEYGSSSAAWIPSDPAGIPKVTGELASSYWRMNNEEPPLTPAFSQYSPSIQHPPQSTWPPTPADHGPREELGWSVPQRSMSYNLESTIRHNSNYAPFQHPSVQSNIREDFTHRPQHAPQSDLYAPSIRPGANPMSGTEVNSASTAAEAHTPQLAQSSMPLPPPSFPAQSPQTWQPYTYSKPALPPGNEPYGGWYYPPGPVQHQESQGEGIAPTYGHPEPYGGMHSYPNATQGGR